MENEVNRKRWFKVTDTTSGFIEAVDAQEAEELWLEDPDYNDFVIKAEEYEGPLPFCQCEKGK